MEISRLKSGIPKTNQRQNLQQNSLSSASEYSTYNSMSRHFFVVVFRDFFLAKEALGKVKLLLTYTCPSVKMDIEGNKEIKRKDMIAPRYGGGVLL